MMQMGTMYMILQVNGLDISWAVMAVVALDVVYTTKNQLLGSVKFEFIDKNDYAY